MLDGDPFPRQGVLQAQRLVPQLGVGEALAREVRPFKVPSGKDGKVRTLGEYVNRTPRGQMSKVMLEGTSWTTARIGIGDRHRQGDTSSTRFPTSSLKPWQELSVY